jgi:hypothetical protein
MTKTMLGKGWLFNEKRIGIERYQIPITILKDGDGRTAREYPKSIVPLPFCNA